jgi:ribose transport system substrate-binding protein
MSQSTRTHPWRAQMDDDIAKAAAAKGNINVIFKDAQDDSLRQRSHVEEFISADVDLIMIMPNEAVPLAAPVEKAMDAGIPVIVMGSRVATDKYTTFVCGDNYRIGKAVGEWVVDRLDGTGRVVELKGLMTSTPGQERHKGFRDAIAGTGIEVIFEADMKWLGPNARKEMESALARFDDIDLVYAHNDPAAFSAYIAADGAGRSEEMIFVGIDSMPQEGVAYVQQGLIDATFEYPNGAYEAIALAEKILRGEQVPKDVLIPSRLYTKENAAAGGEYLWEAPEALQGLRDGATKNEEAVPAQE